MIILRFILWSAIVVAIVMGALWMEWITLGPPSPDRTIPTVEFGGTLALTNHRGEPFTHKNLKGKPMLSFSHSHCSDVCPPVLWELSEP